jgi:hypothetical protein
VDAPYVALIGAVEGWLDSAGPAPRPGGGSDAAELLPSLGGQPTPGTVRLLPVIDGLVQELVAERPAVLVVDDVQWADLARRDAILYLIAGFRSQRLAVLATYRDEELAAGDPLHAWLADPARRSPPVHAGSVLMPACQPARYLLRCLLRRQISRIFTRLGMRSDVSQSMVAAPEWMTSTLPVQTLPKLSGVEFGEPPPLRPAYAPDASTICQCPAPSVAVHSSSHTTTARVSITIVPSALVSTLGHGWCFLRTGRSRCKCRRRYDSVRFPVDCYAPPTLRANSA